MEEKNYSYPLENIIKNNFYGYDPEKLWQLCKRKKIRKEKTKNVKHWVYKQCWSYNNELISIYQVILNKNKYFDHFTRILESDLGYPLLF